MPEYEIDLPQNLKEKTWLRTVDNDTQLKKAIDSK